MNKRQSKKKELQEQVDDFKAQIKTLQKVSSVNLSSLKFTDERLNQSITRSNKNFEVIGKDIETIDTALGSIDRKQSDVIPEVAKNRLAILDIQSKLKFLNFDSIFHTVAITALAIALILKG